MADDVTLWHGDCLELMGQIPDGSVDMIAADLPYGTTDIRWDSAIPFEPLWAHYKRIIKPLGTIALTASQPFTSALVMSNPQWFKYCWVWEKVGGTGNNARNSPIKVHEDIAVFSPGKCGNGSHARMTYNPQGLKPATRPPRIKLDGGEKQSRRPGRKPVYRLEAPEYSNYPRSVLKFNRDGSTVNRLHPTQKPVALFEYLIKTYTNDGETVLDNTMGSGTTGVACIRTGRKFIGIEQDADYFAIAQQRIAAEQAKTALLTGA